MNRIGMLVVLVAGAAVIGCSRPPAVEFENLHLIASLRTACSAKSEPWLAGVERAVQLRHEEGRMSEVEKAHFAKLIDQARGGDWHGAEKQCLRFEEAQLSRTRIRPPQAHHHDHPHPVAGLHIAER